MNDPLHIKIVSKKTDRRTVCTFLYVPNQRIILKNPIFKQIHSQTEMNNSIYQRINLISLATNNLIQLQLHLFYRSIQQICSF